MTKQCRRKISQEDGSTWDCYWNTSGGAGAENNYVTELRNLHRQKSRPRSSIAVSEGDVVTVLEDNLPRSQWKLGRVEQLIHDADDRVRAAVVKVISKSGRPVTMKRPVQRLFPLEIPVVSNDEQPQEEQIIDGVMPPRRLAARNTDYIRRLVDK